MRLKWPDAIALFAVPLVVVAYKAGGAILPTLCLSLAGAVVVFALAGHDELAWKHRIAGSTFIFAVAVGMVVYLYRINLARERNEKAAPLMAATLPSPVSSNCPIPKGAVALYLGNTVSVVTKFPHVVFRVGQEDVFVLDRDASGLLVTFAVFDDRGNVVARLERNTLVAINPAAYVERPDSSNLIVFDDRDTKVLDVQFLNPQAIKITGILRYPGKDLIIITEKYLGIHGSISPQSCGTGTDADFLFH
jgi:hypothetical protein